MPFQGDKSRRGLSDLQQLQSRFHSYSNCNPGSTRTTMETGFTKVHAQDRPLFNTVVDAACCAPVATNGGQASAGLVGGAAAAAHRTGAAAARLVGWAAAAAHWARTAAWHSTLMSTKVCTPEHSHGCVLSMLHSPVAIVAHGLWAPVGLGVRSACHSDNLGDGPTCACDNRGRDCARPQPH
jgi:hypothetical protein